MAQKEPGFKPLRTFTTAAVVAAAIGGGVKAVEGGQDSAAAGARVEHVTPTETVEAKPPIENQGESVQQAIDYLQTHPTANVLSGRWDLGTGTPADNLVVTGVNHEAHSFTVAATTAGDGLKTFTFDADHFYAKRIDLDPNAPTGVASFDTLQQYLITQEATVTNVGLENYTPDNPKNFGIVGTIVDANNASQQVRIGRVVDNLSPEGPAIS